MTDEVGIDKDDMASLMDNGEPEEMDQGDIDAIIGNDAVEENLNFENLEQEIIHKSRMNYENLPMLDVMADRLVVQLTTSLKTHTSAAADVSVKVLEYSSYEDAIGQINIPSLLNIVHADAWNGNLLLAVDAKLLYAALEIQLGGRRSDPARAEGRNFTPIEVAIGKKFSEVILQDLSKCFSQLSQVSFEIKSTESNPQFAAISQPVNPTVRISLEISLDNRKGRVELIIPYSTLEPVRGILSKVFLGEKLGSDEQWQDHVKGEVEASFVDVRAVLHEGEMSMLDMLSWRVGDTINLDIPEDKECILYGSGVPMCNGRMGKSKNKIAVRITEVNLKDKDLK
jgi:flagellar motor switch protein FliM